MSAESTQKSHRPFLISAAILIVLLSAGPEAGVSAAPGDELKDLARDAKSSVLLLRVLDPSGREIGSGTGFFVSSDGLLVTNQHVIASAHRVEAVPAEGPPLEILGVVAEDEANDLAVLRIEAGSSRPLPLADLDIPDPGEKIVVLGGPLGLAGSLSEGIVSAVRESSELEHHDQDASSLLQITAAISPGSSGSPVMKLSGEVVGIAVGQYRFGQNLNFAVPVAALHDLLARIEPGAPALPLSSVAGTARSHYARNRLISAVFFGILLLGLRRLR